MPPKRRHVDPLPVEAAPASARRSSPGLALALVLLCACPTPPPPGSSTDTATATGATSSTTTDTGATATVTVTDTDTDADTDTASCPPWTPTRCLDAEEDELDPATVECASRGMAECGGPVEPGSQEQCSWVYTVRVGADALSCADGEASGTCIALSYYGDGCSVDSTCGGDVEGAVYYRLLEGCAVETFRGEFCGYNVLDWSTCAWGVQGGDGDPARQVCAPPADGGPAACACAC